jgi:hypothetical protein
MEGTLAADGASRRNVALAGQQKCSGGGLGRFSIKAQANAAGNTIGLLALISSWMTIPAKGASFIADKPAARLRRGVSI